jgi:hypothetical protein
MLPPPHTQRGNFYKGAWQELFYNDRVCAYLHIYIFYFSPKQTNNLQLPPQVPMTKPYIRRICVGNQIVRLDYAGQGSIISYQKLFVKDC